MYITGEELRHSVTTTDNAPRRMSRITDDLERCLYKDRCSMFNARRRIFGTQVVM